MFKNVEEEKRKSKRIKTKDLFGFFQTEDGRYECEIIDISEGGLRFKIASGNISELISFSENQVLVDISPINENGNFAWGYGLIRDFLDQICSIEFYAANTQKIKELIAKESLKEKMRNSIEESVKSSAERKMTRKKAILELDRLFSHL